MAPSPAVMSILENCNSGPIVSPAHYSLPLLKHHSNPHVTYGDITIALWITLHKFKVYPVVARPDTIIRVRVIRLLRIGHQTSSFHKQGFHPYRLFKSNRCFGLGSLPCGLALNPAEQK